MFHGFLRTDLRTTMNIFLGIGDFVFLFFRCAYDVAPSMISQQKGGWPSPIEGRPLVDNGDLIGGGSQKWM